MAPLGVGQQKTTANSKLSAHTLIQLILVLKSDSSPSFARLRVSGLTDTKSFRILFLLRFLLWPRFAGRACDTDTFIYMNERLDIWEP
jgi:hypothetical protein